MEKASIYELKGKTFDLLLIMLQEYAMLKYKKDELESLIDISLNEGNRDAFIEYSLMWRFIVDRLRELDKLRDSEKNRVN